ncbi:hypothetical protein [Streptomyces mirabilis]
MPFDAGGAGAQGAGLDDVGGLDHEVAGGLDGYGEAAAVRVGARPGLGGLHHHGSKCLVEGEQGPHLLLDADQVA